MYKLTGGNILLDVNLIFTKAGIEEGMKVADLGCGTTGHFVFPAADLVGEKGTVYAIDILKTAIEAINRRIKQEKVRNIKTIWSDLEIFNATKIESGSLDIVLLINTLYQSHKRMEILREAARLLKRGGKLVVVEWKNIALPFGPPLNERVQVDMLKKGALKFGLELEKDFFVGHFHFGSIFIKM